MPAPARGLYEQLITLELQVRLREIDEGLVERETLSPAEAADQLARISHEE